MKSFSSNSIENYAGIDQIEWFSRRGRKGSGPAGKTAQNVVSHMPHVAQMAVHRW